MATAPIPKNVTPRLMHQFTVKRSSLVPSRTVEIWRTSCIVTNFGRQKLWDLNPYVNSDELMKLQKEQTWILMNPSNPALTGCSLFEYFQKGGPPPLHNIKEAFHHSWIIANWGDCIVTGIGVVYPKDVVDGLVHLHGGTQLQEELDVIREVHNTFMWLKWFGAHFPKPKHVNRYDPEELKLAYRDPCPVGTALQTYSGNGALSEQYNHIIHTTPPFYKHNNNPFYSVDQLLSFCYSKSFNIAFCEEKYEAPDAIIVSAPLLGAGCRGFPSSIASRIAATSVVRWLLNIPPSYKSDYKDLPITIIEHRNLWDEPTHTVTEYPPIRHNEYGNVSDVTSSIIFNSRKASVDQQRHEIVVFAVLEDHIADQLAKQIQRQMNNPDVLKQH